MKTLLRLFLSALLPLTSLPVPAAFAADAFSPDKRGAAIHTALKKSDISPAHTFGDMTTQGNWLKEIRTALTAEKANTQPFKDNTNVLYSLTDFESGYFLQRVAALGAIEQAKILRDAIIHKEDSPGAKVKNIVRAAIWKDVEAYDPAKDSTEEVAAIFKKLKALKDADSEKILAALGNANESDSPATPTEKPKPACASLLAKIFRNPIECAVVEALQGSDLVSANPKFDDKMQANIKTWLADYLSKDEYAPGGAQPSSPALAKLSPAYFKDRGISQKQLLRFYCDARYPNGMADATSGQSAVGAGNVQATLRQMSGEGQAAALANSLEGAKGTAGQTTDNTGATQPSDPMFGKCSEYYKKKKLEDALNTTTDQTPNIAGGSIRPVPDLKGGDVEDKKKEEEKKAKIPWEKIAIGGGTGAIAMGLLGFLIGGPIGAIALGALGGAAFAGITYMNNK